MHLSAAFTHLHRLVHPFLQPQLMSSWHAWDASEIVVHSGFQPVVFFYIPNWQGQEIPA